METKSTVPERGVQWLSRLLAVLAVGFALGALTVVMRPPELIITAPVIDDSFYSFTVARNIALGRGISVDGVTPTNGFQPLFTFLTVPLFWLTGGDRISGIRAVLTLQWGVFCTTAFLLGRIAKDSLPEAEKLRVPAGWVITLLYLASFPAYGVHLNGLETGFVLFLEVLIWRFLQLNPLGRQTWKLGVLAGLLILARIDTVFLVGGISLLFWTPWFQAGLLGRARECLKFGGLVLTVSLPWWLYNYIVFQSFMPTSGQAQMRGTSSYDWLNQGITGLERISAAFSISPFFSPEFPIDLITGWAGLGVVGCGLLRWGTLFRYGRREGTADCNSQTSRFLFPLAGAMVILFFWYSITSFAYWHYERYFAPMLLLIFGGLMALLPWLIRGFSRFPLLIFMVVGLFLLRAPLMWFDQQTRMVEIFSFQDSYIDQYRLVRCIVPEQESVAAAQTGILGYFRDRVINLDGKVNRDALKFRPRNPPESNTLTYLRQRDVRWFCDKRVFVTSFLGGRFFMPTRFGWQEYRRMGDWILFKYVGDVPNPDPGTPERQGSNR